MIRVSSMYIRTKNRIYKVESETYDKQGYYTGDYDVTSNVILKEQVINQSENLFELIDEFVVIRDNTKINQLVRTDSIGYLKEMIKEDKRIVEIKGAIWTDWGLKYVAKMTNEGKVGIDMKLEDKYGQTCLTDLHPGDIIPTCGGEYRIITSEDIDEEGCLKTNTTTSNKLEDREDKGK